MHMRSSTRHVLVVTCFVFLLGSLCSPREVPMRPEQKILDIGEFHRSRATTLLAWGAYLLGVPSQIVSCFGSRS